ncbi:MAG: PASTA domain-containing protein [Candidatus Eremiobacteraeota bacterium]|nr:PASTA domain-containing protein [Candidatus Eremiobacteraeota bacterium]
MLAIFVALVVWFGREIHDFLLPPADTVTVPSFVGQTLADATNAATRMKLSSSVIDRATSDRYPKGVVISQRPDPGTEVREGRQISYVVSDGIVTRLMPDLRYQSMREVGFDLARTHLQLGKVAYSKSDVIPDAHVISQDPAPLASVLEGDKVNLLVSRGASAISHVPNFVGMSVDQARALADRSNVKLGQLVWTPLGSGGPAHGIVARQSIPGGSKIDSYEQVSLDLSAGPNESGYILRQVRVLASVPVSDSAKPGESVKIVLRVRDATGQYDAYRAYAQPGQKLDFVVTTLGTSIVDLLANDALVGESRLGNEPVKIYDEGKPSPTPSSPAR